MKTESYKCMNPLCGSEFKAGPGMVTCHGCRSIYVRWVNFEADWEINSENYWVRKDAKPVVDKNPSM